MALAAPSVGFAFVRYDSAIFEQARMALAAPSVRAVDSNLWDKQHVYVMNGSVKREQSRINSSLAKRENHRA